MTTNPIKLSFPCPACGVQLTICQTIANAPCPHCRVPIQVRLNTNVYEANQGPIYGSMGNVGNNANMGNNVNNVNNVNNDNTGSNHKNTFDRRRFRPTENSGNLGAKPQHRLSDHQ